MRVRPLHLKNLFLQIRLIYFFFLFALTSLLSAQKLPEPVAKFSFNNKSDEDEISHKKPKLVNTKFVEDRFGNAESALNLFGDHDSYVNLGNYPALKNRSGSISTWIRISSIMYSGTGIPANPVIATRNCACSDYNEAYAIYLNTDAKKFDGIMSNDSLKQINLQGASVNFEAYKWYHLVLTYNDDSASLYMNGKQEISVGKKFKSHFEPTDSVIVGIIYNAKNKRVLRGTVDDIYIYDKVLTPGEVRLLYNAPNPNKNQIILEKILIALAILGILFMIYLFIRYRFNLSLKREKERLGLSNTLLEHELRVNRALMNPHFMFNSLNTLHHYILTNNIETASHYLVKFSKLIRKILDSNMSDTILLEQEIELLDNYLEIESLRFKEHIHYSISKTPDVVPAAITIPIMMLQPFIENSVWHGLRDKVGEKTISISFSLRGEGYVECVIEDNGTGRKPRPRMPSGKKSLATNFVMQRLALLNKIYGLHCELDIIDKEEGKGTIVKIVLPILNKQNSYALTVGHH